MKKIVLALLLMIIPLCSAYFISESIDSAAKKYMGYDEILMNISVVEYKGQSYYLASYTKNLQYSGSAIIDKNAQAVSDLDTNQVFCTAEILHSNYPREGVNLYTTFSSHYKLLAKELPDTISNDALAISALLDSSAASMISSINSFSPDFADSYINSEDRLLSKIIESNNRLSEGKIDTSSGAAYEYQQSLNTLYRELSTNRDNLKKSCDMLSSMTEARISGEQKRQDADIGMIAATVAVAVIAFAGIALKKKNKI